MSKEIQHSTVKEPDIEFDIKVEDQVPDDRSQDSYIFPITNDKYHEQILTLLKIDNNEPLNQLYYKQVPQINKRSLLVSDLSTLLNDSQGKSSMDSLLPDTLFEQRIASINLSSRE